MEAQTLKGFRDYPPEEMLVREEMLGRVRRVFESFGFAPLHTPALEYAEILLGKYGAEGEKLLYKFEDHGGRTVALRYDLTVPLARFVAMNPNLAFPFRRYHVAPVWRAERPQKGRFREFYQCDVDLVGVESAQADAECLLIDHAVMQALGISGYSIMFNHRGFLDGLLAHLSIDGPRTVGVLRVLDKIDKVGRQELATMLTAEGLSEMQVGTLVGLVDVSGASWSNTQAFDAALKLAGNRPVAVGAIDRLREVAALAEASAPGLPIEFNPSIARGLDYYTGIVYETFLPAEYGVGSVMSGGRYDNLLGSLSGRPTPAVGISLGIDRLLSALASRSETAVRAVSQLLVCTMDGAEQYAAKVAGQLRRELAAHGLGVELYPKAAKLKKQLEYADKRGILVAAIAGGDEAASGQVTVRSMKGGVQQKMDLDDAAEAVLAMVAR